MNSLVQFRHELHRNPELSGQELTTAARVIKKIRGYVPDELLYGIGGHGIIATFKSPHPGPEVLFRAELDALPIVEENNLSYRSQSTGVSHKCGHDGHAAILVGLAEKIRQNPIQRGTVHLLFQPAEETGEGALSMLSDPSFPNISPDFAFALHNLPGYPLHQVLCKTGTLTPAVKSLIVCLHGKTSHAAEPENGHNPSFAIAKMIEYISSINQRDSSRSDFFLVTPVHVTIGEKAYGVSAGYGELHLTLRCWTNDFMETQTDTLLHTFHQLATAENLVMETEWTNNFSANENNKEAVELIKKATKNNDFDYKNLSTPLKWGEDFGLFTQQYPGAMFVLGAGEQSPALHNPDYDFPDELLPTGIAMFDDIITQLLR